MLAGRIPTDSAVRSAPAAAGRQRADDLELHLDGAMRPGPLEVADRLGLDVGGDHFWTLAACEAMSLDGTAEMTALRNPANSGDSSWNTCPMRRDFCAIDCVRGRRSDS